MAGLSAVVRGVRDLLRRGAAVIHARDPEQPWMADHRWERRGGRDEEPAEGRATLAAAAVMLLLLVPFNWGAFWSTGRPPLLLKVLTLVFDLVALGYVGQGVYFIARRLRYGESRIAFARVPFRPGTTAELLLDGLSPRARVHPLRATLRYVEVRYHTVGRTRQTVAVPYEVWRAEEDVAPGARRVCFAIPDGAPTTTLAARPPRYWELELRAEPPEVDYRARFLVPVYQ